jgi:hypothetical protein
MVVKMMRWRPWPPLVSKKYEVRLVVRRMEGWDVVREAVAAAPGTSSGGDLKDKSEKLTVEIRWKGPKLALSSLRRTAVKRNFTKEVEVCGAEGENGGVLVEWDEEFESLCTLSAYKENVFHPWEISFTVFNVSSSFLFCFSLQRNLFFFSRCFMGLLCYCHLSCGMLSSCLLR